jgi:hypothetical protein
MRTLAQRLSAAEPQPNSPRPENRAEAQKAQREKILPKMKSFLNLQCRERREIENHWDQGDSHDKNLKCFWRGLQS